MFDRVGLWTATIDGVPAREIASLAAEVEDQGWSSIWFGEAYGREAFSTASLLLANTSRVTVGTGIANIYGRDAIACAAAARTLHATSGGRFALGLGVSHAPLVERMRGQAYGRPLEVIGSYLDAIASAPAIVPGETDLPPIVLAALGPRMLELARERADAAFPYLVTARHTAEARERLGPDVRLIVEQAVVVSPDADEEEWRRRAHDHLQLYTGLDNYRRSLRKQGFDESDLARGGSEALKQALVPHGPAASRERLEEHLAAGADEVLVQVLGPGILEPPRGDWAVLAGALR